MRKKIFTWTYIFTWCIQITALLRYMMKSKYVQTTMHFKLGSTTNPVLKLWNIITISLKYPFNIVLHSNATSCRLHLIMLNPKFSIIFWLVTSQNYILLSDYLTSVNLGNIPVAETRSPLSVCLLRYQSYKTVLPNSQSTQIPTLIIQHSVLKVSLFTLFYQYSALISKIVFCQSNIRPSLRSAAESANSVFLLML